MPSRVSHINDRQDDDLPAVMLQFRDNDLSELLVTRVEIDGQQRVRV
jgi:hypothetical protein